MKNVIIYEPAMCCDTGVCGVGVDPELIRISAVINGLKKHGITVNRYNLSSAPMEFIKNETVSEYLKDKGVDGLPVVTLDDVIAIGGRYPTGPEFAQMLDIPESYLSGADTDLEKPKAKGGCCCSGECCC